ncbi:MAG: ferredoxin Fer [Halobacteriales archaeon]
MPTVEYLNYEVVEENGWSVDADAFEKARDADLPEKDHGQFEVENDEYILDAAEREGYAWHHECRAGTCATCAAVVVEGEVEMDVPPILSADEVDDGFRLTCIGLAKTDAKILYNAKESDRLDILV